MSEDIDMLVTALRTESAEETGLLAALAEKVSTESAVSYRESLHAVQLADCGGIAVEQWELPREVTASFVQ